MAAVKKLVLMGATDNDLAEAFEVHPDTVQNWKKQRPDFFESLKDWKLEADAKVERSLYQRAVGFSHDEDKIFNNNGEPLVVPTVKHYPPDATSAIFWLKNRKPSEWRDKQPEEEKDNDDLVGALNNLAARLPD